MFFTRRFEVRHHRLKYHKAENVFTLLSDSLYTERRPQVNREYRNLIAQIYLQCEIVFLA